MRERTEPILSPAVEDTEDGSAASPASQKTLPANAVAGMARDDADEAMVGRILAGRYELKSVLGRGGMGVVYDARHIALGRSVAVKVLRRDLARSGDSVARFHREARAAASIGSPFIVEVFDFGFTDDADAYIAMERLEGIDLRKLVRNEGPLATTRALGLARQIARGLAAAHGRGIVHRDLKSENVFVSRRDGAEHVKLLDFGISKVSEIDDSRGPLTSEGVVMGTPHYMAPELLDGATGADERADIYALGCVLYEMLTGAVPFNGRTPMEVAYKHVHEPVEPPSKRRAGLSPALDALVLHALAKPVDERIRNADAFLSALDALERAPPSTTPPSPPKSPPVAPSRRPVLVLGALAATALGVALASRTPDPAPVAGPTTRADASTTSADPAAPDVAPRAIDGAIAAPDAPTTDALERQRLDANANGAAMDSAGARRSDRVAAPNLTTDPSRADGAATVALSTRDAEPSIAPLLPDAAPRSPDDGLKQTPYGSHRAR